MTLVYSVHNLLLHHSYRGLSFSFFFFLTFWCDRQSLVVTVHGLKWGQDDNKDAMLGRALGYLVLYSTLGMMVCVYL